MKKLYIFLFSLIATQTLSSQTVLINEGFEGPTTIFSSSSTSGTSGPWSITSSLANTGANSDSNIVQLGDTLYLSSNAFSTVNYSHLTLEFHHIAKIHLIDRAAVEISSDNGATWTELTDSEYLGSAFLVSNKYFSSLSYPIWDPANFTSAPQNSWWKKEVYDISSIANANNAKIRFVLMDSDNNGSRGSYGWLLDDVKIIGASCEMVPPSIDPTGNTYNGNVHSKGPFLITAEVQDASGVSSVHLEYSVDGGGMNSVIMTNTSGNLYEAFIPSMSYGDTVCYRISATDNSACANTQIEPKFGCTEFYVVQGAPVFCNGNVESSFPYSENFDQFTVGSGIYNPGVMLNNWQNIANYTHPWIVETGATNSLNTGPTSDHTSGFGNYVYIEASGFSNSTAILESPCFDLSGYSKKKMGFWYHMYGADMGELHIDIETVNGKLLDIVPPIIGNQGNSWKYMEIDLSSYSGSVVQIEFRGTVGNNFRSDIALDDFSITEEPSDVKLVDLISPSATACLGSSSEYVTVEIENLGAVAVDTIPLAYQVNGGNIVNDTAFLNIPPNSSTLFTFQNSVNMSLHPSYNFKVWAELHNDAVRNNDTLQRTLSTTSINVLFPDTQNFESFTVGTPGLLKDGWMNDAADLNEWYVHTGSTPTVLTGPTGDTSGLSNNGNYLYVDASASIGQFASLMSPCLDLGNMVKPRMSFYYHMYGADMGTLHLDIIVNGIRFNDIIPPISGDKGNQWKEVSVDLSQYGNTSKLVFRAEKGNGNQGDIAIDQIIFFDEPVGLSDNKQTDGLNFQFYPNPSFGSINVEVGRRNLGGVLEIKDITGKILKKEILDEELKEIDLGQLKSGVYFISYKLYNSAEMEKMILIN